MSNTPYSGTSPFEAIKQVIDGVDRWSARDLMPLLGYRKWERFEDLIDRAKATCRNMGVSLKDHFPGAGKMVDIGSGAQRESADFLLSRHAANIVAMNGDSRKPEIAAAQTYFSVRTMQAEVMEAQAHKLPQTMSEALRLAADLADAKERLELKVREMAPKANFADAVVKAVNSQTIDQAAKILGTGEKRLFKFLREHGYLRRNNQPYQKYLAEGDGLGYFRLCLREYTDMNGEVHVYARTLVTGKGIEYLQRKYFGGQMRGMEPEKPLTLQVWTA